MVPLRSVKEFLLKNMIKLKITCTVQTTKYTRKYSASPESQNYKTIDSEKLQNKRKILNFGPNLYK